jgi:hypothetical protein
MEADSKDQVKIPCLFWFHFKEFVFYGVVMASSQAVAAQCAGD